MQAQQPRSVKDFFDDGHESSEEEEELGEPTTLSKEKAEKLTKFQQQNPQGEMPMPGYEPRHRNALIGPEAFDGLDEWLDELARNAIEICRLWGYSFWNGNRNLYSVSGLSWEDLSSLLFEQVWSLRYLPKLTDGSFKCTIKDFRSQFYIGCRMHCWIHRRSRLAKKRYWEEGQVFSLSNSGKCDNDELDVSGPSEPSAMMRKAKTGRMREGTEDDRQRIGIPAHLTNLRVTDEVGAELIATAKHDGRVISFYSDKYLKSVADSYQPPVVYSDLASDRVPTDFLRRSGEVCSQMSLTAIRAHLLVLFKPRQYPTIAALARRFGMSTVKLQQLIEEGTRASTSHASSSNYGRIISDCTYTTLTTPADMSKLDKDALRAVATAALHSGALRRKSPGEQAAELIPGLPEPVQRMIYDMICSINEGKPLNTILSQPPPAQSDQRIAQFGARMVANLDIDYEILNAALNIEINPEINPVVAWRLISSRLAGMGEDDRSSILDHPHLGRLIEAIKVCSNGSGVLAFNRPLVATPLYDEASDDDSDIGGSLEPIVTQRPRTGYSFIATRVGEQQDAFNFIPISASMTKVWSEISSVIQQNAIGEILGVDVQYPNPNRKIKGAFISGPILVGLTTMQVQRMLNTWFNPD